MVLIRRDGRPATFVECLGSGRDLSLHMDQNDLVATLSGLQHDQTSLVGHQRSVSQTGKRTIGKGIVAFGKKFSELVFQGEGSFGDEFSAQPFYICGFP